MADLNLSIDGQCTSDEALRDLAETVTGDRWLALGAAGTARSGWHPERWTHHPVILSGHDIDPAAPLPQAGCSGHPPASPDTSLPIDMSYGTTHPVPFRRWDG